jgi:hypothetical protein
VSGAVVVVSLIGLPTVSGAVLVLSWIGLPAVSDAVVVVTLIGLPTASGTVVVCLIGLAAVSGAVVVVSLFGLVMDTARSFVSLLLPGPKSTERRLEALNEYSFDSGGAALAATVILEDLNEYRFDSGGAAFAVIVVVAILCDPQRDVASVLMAPEVPQPSALVSGSYSAFKSTAAMLAEAIFSEGEQQLAASSASKRTKSASSQEGTGGDGMVFSVHSGAFSSTLCSKQAAGGDGTDSSTSSLVSEMNTSFSRMSTATGVDGDSGIGE